mgnify:FL=1
MPRSRIIMSLCYDHRMSKFFELALAFGMVPHINFCTSRGLCKGGQMLMSEKQNWAKVFGACMNIFN